MHSPCSDSLSIRSLCLVQKYIIRLIYIASCVSRALAWYCLEKGVLFPTSFCFVLNIISSETDKTDFSLTSLCALSASKRAPCIVMPISAQTLGGTTLFSTSGSKVPSKAYSVERISLHTIYAARARLKASVSP